MGVAADTRRAVWEAALAAANLKVIVISLDALSQCGAPHAPQTADVAFVDMGAGCPLDRVLLVLGAASAACVTMVVSVLSSDAPLEHAAARGAHGRAKRWRLAIDMLGQRARRSGWRVTFLHLLSDRESERCAVFRQL